MRLKYENLKELLRHYFNGEIDRITRNLKEKVNQKYPEEYYCTIYGIDHTRPKAGTSSYHSDPTANRAIKLADLRLERMNEYNKYLDMKKTINEYISTLNNDDITFLKAYIELITWKEAKKETGASMGRCKRKGRYITVVLSQKFEKYIEFTESEQEEDIFDIELRYL